MGKIFFYDLETTGLDSKKCAIHQIAAVIEVDGQIQHRLNWRVQPHEGATIYQEALDVSGVSLSGIMNYEPMGRVFNSFKSILLKTVGIEKDKLILCGYNNDHFDNKFLRAFFKRNNSGLFDVIFKGSHDVKKMSLEYMSKNKISPDNNRLSGAYESVVGKKIDHERWHDAMYDVSITREIYKKIKQSKYDRVA